MNQNPSSWPRRIPVFGAHSNEAVLTSSITRLPPLPDATLGALAYVVEAIVTIVGGSCRWRTAPWLVIVYGLVLAGLALTSLVLVLMQIFLVHALDPMHWELLPHNLGFPVPSSGFVAPHYRTSRSSRSDVVDVSFMQLPERRSSG